MYLEMGAAREIITPELGGLFAGYGSKKPSTAIHDDLTATAFVFGYGDVKALLLSVTVCLIPNALCDKLREACGAAAGVPVKDVVVAAIHTHSGPVLSGEADDPYIKNILAPGCIRAAAAAGKRMKPVAMGVASLDSRVGVNRRQLLRDDRVILGQNPWGCCDQEMTVVSFKDSEGAAVANLIHCGAHCTASGINTEVTRDWAGVMIDRLEKETGAVTAFFNGALGDVAPKMANGGSTGDIGHAMELGGLAGIEAVRAYKNIRAYRDEKMTVSYGEIRIPFAPIMPLETARGKLAAIAAKKEEERFDARDRRIYGGVVELYEKGETGDADFVLEQCVIRIGPVAFVPMPFEPFSELSLRLRAYSPVGHTLMIGCANGSNSYLPSQDQICRGGYEIEQFRSRGPRQLPDNADAYLVNQNLEIIKKTTAL